MSGAGLQENKINMVPTLPGAYNPYNRQINRQLQPYISAIKRKVQSSRKVFRRGTLPSQTSWVSEGFLEEYPKC